MTTFGYVRVSTGRQAEEGESLEVQQRRIDGYAAQLGLETTTQVMTFVERGVSGSVVLTERPQGKLLFAALQPGDHVIATKLDRMFRSALDALSMLEQLKARQVHLHLIDLGGDVTGNGIAKMVFTMVSAVAEMERERIQERIADVKRDQAARGMFLGGPRPPFGQHVDANGRLVEDAAEQQAIVTIYELADNDFGLRAIGRHIKELYGINLSHSMIRRILDRRDKTGVDGDKPEC